MSSSAADFPRPLKHAVSCVNEGAGKVTSLQTKQEPLMNCDPAVQDALTRFLGWALKALLLTLRDNLCITDPSATLVEGLRQGMWDSCEVPVLEFMKSSLKAVTQTTRGFGLGKCGSLSATQGPHGGTSRNYMRRKEAGREREKGSQQDGGDGAEGE